MCRYPRQGLDALLGIPLMRYWESVSYPLPLALFCKAFWTSSHIASVCRMYYTMNADKNMMIRSLLKERTATADTPSYHRHVRVTQQCLLIGALTCVGIYNKIELTLYSQLAAYSESSLQQPHYLSQCGHCSALLQRYNAILPVGVNVQKDGLKSSTQFVSKTSDSLDSETYKTSTAQRVCHT